MNQNRFQRLRRRLYEIVEVAKEGDKASRVFDLFIVSLITLNVVALVLETVDPMSRIAEPFFRIFELISVVIFTMEYALRVWLCTQNPKYSRPVLGRLRFAISPMAIIDLLAVAPFYLPFLGVDLRFMRAVRLFRLFRLAKLSRYSRALISIGRVFAAKRAELGVTAFAMAILVLLSASVLYFAEHEAQPDAFSSIPQAMWWAVTCLSTVGYGDVYPVTPAGKLFAAVIAMLGIGMFALPTGILGAAFVTELRHKKSARTTCPHCGKSFEDRSQGEDVEP